MQKKILIVGASYKKNIDDIRESAAIKIAEKFIKDGLFIKFYDPYVKNLILFKITKKLI